MSVATVKAHVSRVLTKLELNNRVQIALLAHDAGLQGTRPGDATTEEHADPGAAGSSTIAPPD